MTLVDKFIRWYRVRVALNAISKGDDLLDVGCHDGYLIAKVSHRFKHCLGIEAQPIEFKKMDNATYITGKFPEDVPSGRIYDCITMLAVAEHFPEETFYNLPDICLDLLKPGGKIVVTQPAIMTDNLLSILESLHLIDEDVHIEEHKGLNPAHLADLFREHPEFTCEKAKRFQLGFNNLMVFRKKTSGA